VDRDRFRRLVARALRSLPPEFAGYLNNVEVVIRREPSAEDLRWSQHGPHGHGASELFGLYVGIPLTERESYGMTLPDRIVIYQGPLERHFPPREIPREVRNTVIHEIAHHFGMDDERLEALGLG
jgi:predicted Zn-dependent protease with MMP-like domain